MSLTKMICLGEIRYICFSARSISVKTRNLDNSCKQSIRNFKRVQYNTGKLKTHSLSGFEGVGKDEGLHINKLWKSLGFTVTFSSACFAGAAIWQYENMRAHAIAMMRQPVGWIKKQFPNSPLNRGSKPHLGEWRNNINVWWNNLTEGQKLFIPICAANVLVFALWRIPQLQTTMVRYFCSNPASNVVCWPMLLSTFSHHSTLHLMANMYVLYSFSSGAVAALGKEQFLGLYLSAGVISSFTSYLYKTVTKQPGLSLGASGAIMAILGFVCVQYPDTKLGIILLPFFTFSAGSAIKALVAMDLAGAVLGWKFFDHAAHLGGALWGISWAYWGNKYIWQNREPLLQYWHDIRGPPQK